ncbi:hypothetical protein Ddc_23618 [Ditylenchus destructor]|nr:hypothetical protein Ddc_23618 [Ditylenchus destructor]
MLFLFAILFISAIYSTAIPPQTAIQLLDNEAAPNIEMGVGDISCSLKVPKIEIVKGKCVRLRSGSTACHSDSYLDPMNEDCLMFG